MNKLRKAISVMSLGAALSLPFSAAAQSTANTFYFKADAGVNWTADTDLKEFFGPVAADSKVQFDIGPRVALGAGYNVTDWFATELEVGFMWNSIDSMTDASEVDAVFGNAPFLLNVKFELPTQGRIKPYVGAGAGGAAMYIDADYIELGGTEVWGAESDVVFAYQFFGGVRFAINDRMSVGLEYRYVGSTDPEFEDDHGFGSGEESIEFGRMEAHAISATFTYRF